MHHNCISAPSPLAQNMIFRMSTGTIWGAGTKWRLFNDDLHYTCSSTDACALAQLRSFDIWHNIHMHLFLTVCFTTPVHHIQFCLSRHLCFLTSYTVYYRIFHNLLLNNFLLRISFYENIIHQNLYRQNLCFSKSHCTVYIQSSLTKSVLNTISFYTIFRYTKSTLNTISFYTLVIYKVPLCPLYFFFV